MATTPGIKLVCTHAGCRERSVARRLCRKHYQAAWKAGELGAHEKLPPRVKKHGYVCPLDHKHAQSTTCYIQHQCRCDDCVTDHSARAQRRGRLKAYGRFDTGLVDADPVREHILMLGEFGIGYKRVAQLAGVGITGVRTLIWGRQDPGDRYGEIPKRVTREKAERILAVRPTVENLGARKSVPATGAHRRVQALVARGWSVSKIGALLDWEPANFHGMMQRDMVGAATHRAIADLYERLWNVEPPRTTMTERAVYTRAVEYARRRRWLPPLAWDDIDTDPEPPAAGDADGGVDEITIELAIAGEAPRLTKDEQIEVVKRLHAARWGDKRIAKALRRDSVVVKRIRDDLGLDAWTIAEQQEAAA